MAKREIQVDIRRADEMLRVAIAGAGKPVQYEVVTNDKDVQEYWPVLEHGSKPDTGPWRKPSTKVSQGKGGRFFSKQAPGGFIAKNSARFLQFLSRAFFKRFQEKKALLAHAELDAAAVEATQQATNLIRREVPKAKGKFRRSIRWREKK